jgi:small subunit ribosomal protein S2
MKIKVSLKKLVETGAHFGHQTRRWNPKMADFLYGEQDGVHVFDLTKTKEKLEEVLDVLETAAKEGKIVLFVGTKKQVKEKIKKVAEEVGYPYVIERWLGGTITNFEQILKSIKKLTEMKASKEKGEYKKFTKKERLLIDREIDRLERFFGGMVDLTEVPDILFVVDTKREAGAIKEAQKKGITTIAIVDSNCDPTQVDYPIPMNDDATQALDYVLSLMQEAILKGKTLKSKPKSKKK